MDAFLASHDLEQSYEVINSSFAILSRLLRDPELTVISIEHKPIPELLPLYDNILALKGKNLVESV